MSQEEPQEQDDWVAIYNYHVDSPESSEESFEGVVWEKAKKTKPWPTNVGKKKYQEQPGTSKQSVPTQDDSTPGQDPTPIEFHESQVVELGENGYGCVICGKTCKKRSTVVSHISRLHLNRKARTCPHCNHEFATVYGLKRHLPQHGVSVSEFVCDICEKSFALKDLIRQHMQIHVKGELFKCEVCNKKFKHARSLKRHTKSKRHLETVRRRVVTKRLQTLRNTKFLISKFRFIFYFSNKLTFV